MDDISCLVDLLGKCREALEPSPQEQRIAALSTALKAVLDMETNRYACASERNLVFATARKVLEDTDNT